MGRESAGDGGRRRCGRNGRTERVANCAGVDFRRCVAFCYDLDDLPRRLFPSASCRASDRRVVHVAPGHSDLPRPGERILRRRGVRARRGAAQQNRSDGGDGRSAGEGSAAGHQGPRPLYLRHPARHYARISRPRVDRRAGARGARGSLSRTVRHDAASGGGPHRGRRGHGVRHHHVPAHRARRARAEVHRARQA